MLDEAEDTLTINSLVDVVHAASGDVSSGNIIGAVQITTTRPDGADLCGCDRGLRHRSASPYPAPG